MTNYELFEYAVITTALTVMCVPIYEVLNWLCQKADEEYKQNKKNEENEENEEDKENKPKDKEPI